MSWKEFKLKNWLVDNLLANVYLEPTKIQKEVIQETLDLKNLIVSSPTGSGKTHAFLIPLINKVDDSNQQVQVVIISPTRELANQIYQFAKQLTFNTNIKVSLLTGGKDFEKQKAKVNNIQPQIVIGTITRIKMLYEEQVLNITTASSLVLDECDMLFELGFIKELDFIISKMNKKIQILVFSATINQNLQVFLKKYITNTKIIDLNKNQQPKIDHVFVLSPEAKFQDQLLKLVNIINPFLCLIFVNNKNEVEITANLLNNGERKIGLLHGGMTSRSRNQVFKKIKNLDYQYLVCTDIGARGIDIPGVSHVISLNLPSDISYYLHRSGRTGRNNNSGISYVFYDPSNTFLLKKIKTLNISYKFYKIKDLKLVPETDVTFLKKKKKDLNPLAVQTINQFKKQKQVKPKYKKEFNKNMDKIMKQERKKQKQLAIKNQRKKQKSIF